MTENKLSFGLSDDGTIQYQLLTSEYFQSALKLVRDSFFCQENVCVAVGLPNDPEAILELQGLVTNAVKDGVTVIAVDKKTNRVVGAAINKIKVNSPEDDLFYENFAKNCKHARARTILEYIGHASSLVDVYEICQIDCLLEVMLGATSAEYRGKGIATKLREATVEVAKKLIEGVNVKQSIDGSDLKLEPVPKAVTSVLTSFITQKIYQKLGFQIAAEESFAEHSIEGETYASRIGSHTPSVKIVYKKLV